MAYILKLTSAAWRIVSVLEPYDQQGLDRALRVELADGPNADKEIRFHSDGRSQAVYQPGAPGLYTATPLSFKAYTAIHRPMTTPELGRVSQAEGNPVVGQGFIVFDILTAESAFTRRPGGLVAVPSQPR
jgi:hypothetical protein